MSPLIDSRGIRGVSDVTFDVTFGAAHVIFGEAMSSLARLHESALKRAALRRETTFAISIPQRDPPLPPPLIRGGDAIRARTNGPVRPGSQALLGNPRVRSSASRAS